MYSSLATSAAERVCLYVTHHLYCACLVPVNICPATVESRTVSLRLHGITHTPYTFTNWQWIFTGATHITHKNQNTIHTSKSAMVLADHPSVDILMVSTHSRTMMHSTCADYMLKSAIPWYYFMSDMLLPYFLKLPCVPVRGKKLKIWYKEHIHNMEYNWDE